MRKSRNAALAAATATAVAFGGTAVASAEQTGGEVLKGSSTFTSGSSQPGDTGFGEILGEFFKGGPSAVGKVTGADQSVDLDRVWGAERIDEGTAQWARLWRDAVNWTALAAGLGLVFAAGNWALHEGYLPQIPFNFNVKLPF